MTSSAGEEAASFRLGTVTTGSAEPDATLCVMTVSVPPLSSHEFNLSAVESRVRTGRRHNRSHDRANGNFVDLRSEKLFTNVFGNRSTDEIRLFERKPFECHNVGQFIQHKEVI